MKKNLFLMLGLGAVLLTSCDQDITNEIYLPSGGGSVVVTDSTSTSSFRCSPIWRCCNLPSPHEPWTISGNSMT